MFSVFCILSGNSRSYQQWMHTVKVLTVHITPKCFYLCPFFILFFLCFAHFIPELYLIESVIDTTPFEVLVLPLE